MRKAPEIQMIAEFCPAGGKTLVAAGCDGERISRQRRLFRQQPEGQKNATVTPLLPEGNRTDFTLGVGTRIARSFYIDAAYMYVNQADRRGRTVPLTIAETNGLYKDQHAHLFGVTLTYDF